MGSNLVIKNWESIDIIDILHFYENSTSRWFEGWSQLNLRHFRPMESFRRPRFLRKTDWHFKISDAVHIRGLIILLLWMEQPESWPKKWWWQRHNSKCDAFNESSSFIIDQLSKPKLTRLTSTFLVKWVIL